MNSNHKIAFFSDGLIAIMFRHLSYKNLTLLMLLVILISPLAGCTSSPTATESPTNPPSPTSMQEALAKPSATPTNMDISVFQKGITFVDWQKSGYSTLGADQSLTDLASTGANSVAIIVTVYQKTANDTKIMVTDLTPSDDSLIHIISKAHELGLRVLLKPHVDIQSGQWRGEITFSTEDEWKAWFDSYRQITNHYADLAQQTQSEIFCVGTELVKTSTRSNDWESVIADVRTHFSGKLTYASNFDEINNIKWWDALDYIGVDAYYPLPTSSDNPTVDELKAAWVNQGYIASLKELSEEHDRPILLTEIGYRPVKGANKAPWEWQDSTEIDMNLQANLYQAALEVFTKEKWVTGMFFWNWLTDPNQGGIYDADYTPHNKPAEDVLRSFYSR